MPLYAGELNIRRGAPLAEYPAPFSEVLGAQAQDTQLNNPLQALKRLNAMGIAERGETIDIGDPETGRPMEFGPVNRLDAVTARARVKDEGLPLIIPDDGIPEKALDILIKRKREELQRQNVFARGPSGIGPGAARLGVALYESLFDPLNIASAFIPVVGPSRYAAMIGTAGSAMGRAGVRAGVGALEGAVGAALLEPIISAANTAEQADYTMADSLLNIGFGGLFGGGLHVGGGAIRDISQPGWWRIQDPARSPIEAVSVASRVEPETRQAALRTSVVQAAEGRVTDVDALVRADPASVTVYHGSPHVFDRFDSSKIGTGEGAQSYGHGLYFAENPSVSAQYAEYLTRAPAKALDIRELKSRMDETTRQRAKLQAELGDPRNQRLLKEGLLLEGWKLNLESDIARLNDVVELQNKRLAELESTATPQHYKVEIERGVAERMLDWDRPLSEQPEQVKKSLLSIDKVTFGKDRETLAQWHALLGNDAMPMRQSGQDFYIALGEKLGSQKVASELLDSLGIPGIRYLDQGSRAAGDGTRNFVLFDPSLARITERNGEPMTFDDVRAAAQTNAQPAAVRSADPQASDAAARIDSKPADLDAAIKELDESMNATDDLADALGVDVKKELKDYDKAIKRAEDYAKALRAGAACGIA